MDWEQTEGWIIGNHISGKRERETIQTSMENQNISDQNWVMSREVTK